jgi:hypothetical protein
MLDNYTTNAIKANVPLIDVIHGYLKNTMYEWESKEFEDKSYKEGYMDALTGLYALCYDVIFYKQDLEYKTQQETGRDNV